MIDIEGSSSEWTNRQMNNALCLDSGKDIRYPPNESHSTFHFPTLVFSEGPSAFVLRNATLAWPTYQRGKRHEDISIMC